MSEITLAQALENHYARNPSFRRPDTYPAPYRDILLVHDLVHIIYEVDTSLLGEAFAESISYLKTNTELTDHGRFWFSKEGRNIVRRLVHEYTPLVMFRIILYLIYALPATAWKLRRQTKTIPLYTYEYSLDTPIAEIRRQYNITPLKIRPRSFS